MEENSNQKIENGNKETNLKLFDEKIFLEIKKYKETNYELVLKKNNFCDIKINNRWIVGQIIKINDETATVKDIENSENSIKIFLFEVDKISYFRKYTKLNERRIISQRDDLNNLETIKSFIESLIKFNFGDYDEKIYSKNNFKNITPYDMIQNLRGKLFFWFDNVLNVNDNNQGIDICIDIFELILLLLKNYFDYMKKNNDIVIKYKEIIGTELEDVILIDLKYSIVSFENEALSIYNKIMGQYPIYNDFYIKYAKEIKKIILNRYQNSKNIEKICNKKIYEGIINDFRINDDQIIAALPIAYFIDYFNFLNGYNSISNFIISNQNFRFDMIYNYIFIFKKCHAFMEGQNNQLENKLTNQISQIRVYLQKRMMKISEDEIKKNCKDSIIDVCLGLSRIMPFDEIIKINVFEELYLNYILGCFQCKNLEKQIYAIKIFNSIIVSIDRNCKKVTDKNLKIDPDRNIKNMKYDVFINSLNKIKILDYILEDNVHDEIMKRSLPIIILMYKNNFNLKDLEIEAIYEKRKKIIDCLFKKLNEAEKNDKILYETLKNIISKLSQFLFENDREYTYNLIKDFVTKREITLDNIYLIKDFTINYLSQTDIDYIEINNQNNIENVIDEPFNEKKLYGTQLLWEYFLDKYYIDGPLKNNSLIIEIIQECTNSLKEIFYFPIINDNEKYKILMKLINNIKKNESEVQSIYLIKNLISKSYKFMILTKRINDNKNNNIFDLIVENLNNYNSKAFEIEENKTKNFEELSELIFGGFFPYYFNIKTRIELIVQLLNKDIDIDINFENFFILWNFIIKYDYIKEIFYKQLLENINTFSYNFKTMLFQLIFLNDDLFKIDDVLSFKLFYSLMTEINKANGVFILINGMDLRVNKTNDNEIIGIEKLWDILINTKNIEIQDEVSSVLSEICLNVKNPNSKQAITFWSNFFSELIQYLNNLIGNENENKEKENKEIEEKNNINEILTTNESNESFKKEKENKMINLNEFGIKGLIILINKIYEKFGNPGNIIIDISGLSLSVEIIEPNERFLEYNFIYDQKNYKLKISFNEPLYVIRYKISNYFEIPVNTIQFQINSIVDNGKTLIRKFDLCCDFELFNSLIISGNKKFDYSKIINIYVLTISNPIINCPKNPKQILGSLNQLFEILVKLLKNKNKIYTLDVWKLLKNDTDKNEDLNKKINNYILNLNKSDELKNEFNLIFNFDDTNYYYKSYLLSHLIYVLNKFKKNDGFLEQFINSKVWLEKILIFIKNYSVKINDEILSKEINERNEMLQIINYIIEILKILYSLEKEDINNLINEKILGFINDIFYNSINGDIKENLYYSQSKTIEIIFQFICQYNIIFIKFIENILNDSKSKEQFLTILFNGEIESQNHLIKEQFKMFIRRIYDDDLFKQNHDLKITFSKFILLFLLSENTLQKLLEISKKNENLSFNIYFELCDNFIEKISNLNIEFDYNNYVNKILLPQILSNETKEELLSGYFLIIYSISKHYNIIYDDINGKKFDLANYIFYDLLFNKCREDPLNSKSLIIKNQSTFFNATNLLTFLIINDEIKRNEILNKLNEFHNLQFWKSSLYLDWKLSFDDDKKEKFVGLKNLGCTCYMNSLFQILFLIPSFRESILNTESKIEEKNVLFQLKIVFNSLKFIDSKFFSPIDFTKNFDNEELNVREQKDIDEFFNLLIDKLENNLQGTKNENLIKYFFQGRIIDNLTFQEDCSHNRKNEISFYSIQLQIKNKKDLFESLDSFIDGELMKDENAIFCQQCNKKIPAIKHQSFKILPRVLIFVLKRFEFNYNTMTKIKINDYYEFPFEFDMTNYTFDYLNNKDNYDKNKNNNLYKLKGVVVHSGNSEGGHYYSFIYDNDSKEWFEFNDITVKKFNIQNFKKEIFGGFEEIVNFKTKKKEKVVLNRNAYLLFYEKVDVSNCENFNNVEIYNEISNVIKEDIILKKINENIYHYNVEKNIFSVEYHRFILQFLTNMLNLSFNNDELLLFLQHFSRTKDENIKSKDLLKLREKAIGSNLNNFINLGKIKLLNKKNDNNNNIKKVNIIDDNISISFQFLLLYFFNVLVRARDNDYLSCTVDLIKFYLNQYKECSEFFIEEFSDINTLMEYIVNCPILEMKKLFVGIIYCAMIKLYNSFNEESDKKNLINNINLSNQNQQNNINENITNTNNKNNTKSYDMNLIDNIEIEDKAYTERNQTSSFKKFFNKFNHTNSNNKNLPPLDLKVINHLESIYIPKTLLKFINNIIYLIQKIKDDKDSMFLYYILYRFSIISPYTKDHLITKIPLLTYLIYHIYPKYSERNLINYTLNLDLDIIKNTHNILSSITKQNKNESKDKSAIYRKESYIYMLCNNLLTGQRAFSKIDNSYQFKNSEWILDLFLGIKTKQDAFVFSNLVNKVCYNNLENTKIFINVFIKIINNYDSFQLNNIMLVFKRFLIDINDPQDIQTSRIKNTLKEFFKLFLIHNKIYSFCDYCIQFIINIFLCNYEKMFNYVNFFKDSIENMKEWIELNPIAPSMYHIEGLQMFKKEQNSYQDNSQIDIKIFKEKCLKNSKRNISLIDCILNSKIYVFNLFFLEINVPIDYQFEKYIDLTDFKFISCDSILYE